MIGDYLEEFTFDYLLSQALSQVPTEVDKREGSVIYDALAPACYRMAEMYNVIRNIYSNTFASTASGEYLDNRVAEQGLSRYMATNAYKKGYFVSGSDTPMMVPLGARFATISEVSPLIYVVTAAYTDNGVVQPGYYLLMCETAGVTGNEYSGALTNITFISGLSQATLLELVTPARDTETDEELRKRYFEVVNQKSFGGNVAQYREDLLALAGVGAVQIYPTWDGGGSVKISVVDPQYNPITTDFITTLQVMIDPENASGYSGYGLGLAPIGHKVTITTPTTETVDVAATITLYSGITIGQVQSEIEAAIAEYFLTSGEAWGVPSVHNEYALGIYASRITAAIISVSGVANVTNVLLNESANDVILQETGTVQQLPVLGGVTLNVQ